METRTITQRKIYSLVLNPMTDRVESARVTAIAYDESKLRDFYQNEIAEEPYEDHNYHKVFKKGGPLEWYNPADINIPENNFYGHGIHSEWVNEEVCESIEQNYLLIL
jgi:hypothetical protein